MRAFRLGRILLRELLSDGGLERCPEPTQIMDAADQVAAFHDAGATALVPVYHFNALAISRLAPEGGTVVDLGSGSGQFLTYLALHRPDLRIIGVELAPTMVEHGRAYIARLGMSERVELRHGDMTKFAANFDQPVDVISSVFSLHHLPTDENLLACLSQVREMRRRSGCGLWIFDHARPRNQRTAVEFPEVFTPLAAPAFRQDSCNSLLAAFSYAEMVGHLETTELGARHLLSRWMRLYQVHSMVPTEQHSVTAALWHESAMAITHRREWAALQRLFPDCVDAP